MLAERVQDLSLREENVRQEGAAATKANERVAAAQWEVRESASAAVLDAAAKIKDARESFDSQLCEANRWVVETEEVAMNVMARADAAAENIARLEAEL